MSVDERLRIGMSRNAQSLTPDVEAMLSSTLTRHRRTRQVRWAGAAGLVAAACALLALVLPDGWGPGRQGSPVPADRGSASVAPAGRYTGEVGSLASAPSVAGTWTLDFRPQGVLAVSAPPAYPGVVSGVLYAVQSDELRTDLFSQDLCSGQALGRYAVTETGARLVLMAVEDPCTVRVSVLTTTRWEAAP